MNALVARAAAREAPMDARTFEVRGVWFLTSLPERPAPWMVAGRPYLLVLRRRSPRNLPEAVVRDRDTDAVLGIYSWQHARQFFAPHVRESHA